MIGLCQGVSDEGCPLRLVRAGGELTVELVLRDAHPVEGVGESAGDLPHLRGLVGCLDQAVDGERVAKGARDTGGDVAPLGHILLCGGQLGQELGGLRGVVRVAQDGIEGLIGLFRRAGGEARRFKSRVQLSLGGAVFLCGLCDVIEKLYPGNGGGAYRRDCGTGGLGPGDKAVFQSISEGARVLFCRINLFPVFINRLSAPVRALFSLLQVLIVLLGGLGKVPLLDLSAIEPLLPFLDTLGGGLSGLLSLRLSLLPLFDLRSQGGLLLHGVPGGLLQLFQRVFALRHLLPGLSGGIRIFFLMLLRVLQRLAQRLDFLRLLGLDVGQGLALGRQSLHAVGIAPILALHQRQGGFQRFKLAVTVGDRLLIRLLPLDGLFGGRCGIFDRFPILINRGGTSISAGSRLLQVLVVFLDRLFEAVLLDLGLVDLLLPILNALDGGII